MYYIYILKSHRYEDKIYIGFTSALKRRIMQHRSGKNVATRRILPVELVYYEAYKSKEDTKNRERQLKQYGNALGHLKRRISNSLEIIHNT
jgi:putative endonuclease